MRYISCGVTTLHTTVEVELAEEKLYRGEVMSAACNQESYAERSLTGVGKHRDEFLSDSD
jgi:hypothetical protein